MFNETLRCVKMKTKQIFVLLNEELILDLRGIRAYSVEAINRD